MKSQAKQDNNQLKKSQLDLNDQRAELEKLSADQMKMIEQMNEEMKRNQGQGHGACESQVAVLTQQLHHYEQQLVQQSQDSEETQNQYI